VEPTRLRRTYAQPPAERLVESQRRRPADVATARALTAVDAIARDPVYEAGLATAKTLDLEVRHLMIKIDQSGGSLNP